MELETGVDAGERIWGWSERDGAEELDHLGHGPTALWRTYTTAPFSHLFP